MSNTDGLCKTCCEAPADSHDGCRLAASEAEIECLKSDVSRAENARQHEEFWHGETQKALDKANTRIAYLEMELNHADDIGFGASLEERVTENMVLVALAEQLGGCWTLEKLQDQLRQFPNSFDVQISTVRRMLTKALCQFGCDVKKLPEWYIKQYHFYKGYDEYELVCPTVSWPDGRLFIDDTPEALENAKELCRRVNKSFGVRFELSP